MYWDQTPSVAGPDDETQGNLDGTGDADQHVCDGGRPLHLFFLSPQRGIQIGMLLNGIVTKPLYHTTVISCYYMTMDEATKVKPAPDPGGAAFLLVQLGFHAARLYEKRLAPLGIEPRHVGLLRSVAAVEGQSQQALGEMLHIPKSRMVWLVDDLEEHGLVERRRNPTDRRAYALYLTPTGRRRLGEAMEISAQHEAELLADLQPDERGQLIALLRRVAATQGIPRSALPGFPGSKAEGC
jgi:DNA-binding MarR family transcriptional regulator